MIKRLKGLVLEIFASFVCVLPVPVVTVKPDELKGKYALHLDPQGL